MTIWKESLRATDIAQSTDDLNSRVHILKVKGAMVAFPKYPLFGNASVHEKMKLSVAPQTFSITRQLIDLLLLVSLVSGVVSAKASMSPLYLRTHLQLADEVSYY